MMILYNVRIECDSCMYKYTFKKKYTYVCKDMWVQIEPQRLLLFADEMRSFELKVAYSDAAAHNALSGATLYLSLYGSSVLHRTTWCKMHMWYLFFFCTIIGVNGSSCRFDAIIINYAPTFFSLIKINRGAMIGQLIREIESIGVWCVLMD